MPQWQKQFQFKQALSLNKIIHLMLNDHSITIKDKLAAIQKLTDETSANTIQRCYQTARYHECRFCGISLFCRRTVQQKRAGKNKSPL
ncbi:hypothetical protein FGO68_gene13133 [Halteria grandinella]|uniref:Uncharacterized protein n=1 Tax=Halteria grandinella TaxID=5974 RepID=A0A8J8SV83_HALGN|nr:hypothetical protein FGO68_gene13133 [Halteria grandinella]